MSQRVRHIRRCCYGLHSRQSLHVCSSCLGGQSLSELDTDIDLDDSAEQSKVQNVTTLNVITYLAKCIWIQHVKKGRQKDNIPTFSQTC